ncbi:MAG: Glycosyl hydrolases family 43 [candidate division BRC1 bacterium ADurb.BinA364]|nr:MAG: Glycosyl hydrolases family 43 [candidate division BRC1 bacterium ADurb.BinA364]
MVTLETTLTLCMAPSQPWERSWQEGAWVHKRNGVYYMLWSSRLYATPNYSTGFATAPHPLGPWTKHPSNPILAKTERVSGPGHVSLAPSPDGAELFILYHTHCTSAAGGARQLAIDRLRFAPDPPGPDRMFVEGPSVDPQPYPSGAAPAQAVLGLDEFDGPALDRRRWTAIWNEGPREWRLEGGRLKIETRNGDLRGARADGRNVFLQHAPAGDWDAGTRAIFPAREDAEMAFLTVWRDCRNFLALKVGHAGGPTLIVARQTNEEYSEQRFDNEWGDSLHLRVEKRGTLYRFLASPDAVAWTPLGEPIEARFDGEKVGLGAFATDSGRHILAEFDYFSLDPPRR